jgi:hypothetical protein
MNKDQSCALPPLPRDGACDVVNNRGKSRFGQPFSPHKNSLGFVGEGSWRGSARHTYVADLIVPLDERAPACKITDELVQMRVWEVIESGCRLKISCDNCNHETLWTRVYMEKRLSRWKAKTMAAMGIKLRCGGCRSSYVRVWKA